MDKKYLNTYKMELQLSYNVCNDIFNHTSLYQYHHGKLLLHLTLPFEKRPKGNQPGEYLRYYRLRNNLTTYQTTCQAGRHCSSNSAEI